MKEIQHNFSNISEKIAADVSPAHHTVNNGNWCGHSGADSTSKFRSLRGV